MIICTLFVLMKSVIQWNNDEYVNFSFKICFCTTEGEDLLIGLGYFILSIDSQAIHIER